MTQRLALLAFLVHVFLGCAPSKFTGSSDGTGESRSLKSSNPGDDARSKDQFRAGKDVEDGNGNAGGSGSGGADGDGSAGKTSDDSDKTDQSGGLDEDGDGATDGTLSEEDEELIKKLPGVEVTKVGVNFEDRPGRKKDLDYNDAVLCFEGKFKVDGNNVVSIARQKVVGTTFSNAGCSHQVTVEIVHKNGKKEDAISYDSKSPVPVDMPFKVGSRLEVSLVVRNGDCTGGTIHDTQHAQVAPNLCNNR